MAQKAQEKVPESTASLQLLKRIVVRDKEGNITYDSGELKSNSFVLQFLRVMGVVLTDKNQNWDFKDITNTNRTMAAKLQWDDANQPCAINAGIGAQNYGIVVGSGSAAEQNTDYKLATQIDHGTGAGELSHGAQFWVVPAIVGSNVDWVLTRSFTNISGGIVTIAEIGIQVTSTYFPSGVCFARDVLGASVPVSDGGVATVTYTFRTTVSA